MTMELTTAQILAGATTLLSTFTTVVAFLYRQAAKAKDDLIAEKDRAIAALAKTIDYERTQKQAAHDRVEKIATEIGDAVREMLSGLDQVGPIVGADGNLTRQDIKKTGRKVISRLGGALGEDD